MRSLCVDTPRSLLVLASVALAAAGCGGGDSPSQESSDLEEAELAAEYPLADPRQFPEGGAFDPVERAFYVGSLEYGDITRVDANGDESIFVPSNGDEGRLTLGMKVDAERRLLWVCTTLDSLGRIWIHDLESGDRVADIDLTEVTPKAACNDILLEDDGTALVTDRENPILYKVDPAGSASIWVTHPLLDSSLVNMNGLTRTPDKKYLLTATYLKAVLVRIRADDPSDIRKVDLHGDAFTGGLNVLSGPDDLEFMGDDLVVAFDSSIKRLTPDDASWTRAQVRSTKSIGGVTALIEAEGHMYATNGQSVRFLLGHTPKPFKIFRIEPGSLQ